MVFFNSVMARVTRNPKESSNVTPGTTKIIRTMPGATPNGSKTVTEQPKETGLFRQELSMRKLLFMKSLLKAQAEQINSATPPFNIENHQKLFSMYEINYNQLFFQEGTMKIFEARSVNQPEFPLSCRIYGTQDVQPKNSTYLKILRHLGRKHPYIVHTWEIFTDSKYVYVIQDYMSAGNFVSYSAAHPTIPEKQVAFWAKQLYRALDFLGDNGIAHRMVAPNRLVVQQAGREIWIRLSGFKHAIIYWDFLRNDISYQPCVPAEKLKEDGTNFQAPEVYGDPENEQFDPIYADLWSYGANIYFMLIRQYPFNFQSPSDDLDAEIKHNIYNASISEQAKSFCYSLCRANAMDRMPFEFIEKHAWLRANTGLPKNTVANVGGKVLGKMKIKVDGKSEKSTNQSATVKQ